MEVIERKLKKFGFKLRPFKVYTAEEAKQDGLKYVYWKDASVGDWAQTDDGWIVECLSEYKSNGNAQLMFSCGRAWVNDRSRLEFTPRLETRNFYGTSADSWQVSEGKKGRTQRVITMYAHMLLDGKPIKWDLLGRIYRPDQLRPDITVKRLFKEKEITGLIDKKIRELAADRGITEDTAFAWIEKAAAMAEKKGDASNLMRAAENLVKIFGMEPKKQIQTDTMQIDLSRQIEGQIETEQAKLTAKQELKGFEVGNSDSDE
tara:strand:- start:12384 stop:13166 length:783 start_codon:yes stop_codon:yes gene_type:complete